MARKAVLNNEQVFVLRNNPFHWKLKEFVTEFKTSVPTLINAKKGRPPYDQPFTKEFEDEMVSKYYNG